MGNDQISHRPDSEFLKVRNALYNKRHIKQIECDDNKCLLLMANTQTGYTRTVTTSTYINDRIFKDELFECDKFRDPECYNSLFNYINNHN